jgi:CBS domain-containing protein
VELRATVRDALSQLISLGGRPLTVINDRGDVAGIVTLELLGGVLSDGGLATRKEATQEEAT